jgi:hypothetical protein
MELVINYEFLKSLSDEFVIKEVADNAVKTFHFTSPYTLAPNGDVKIGLNWADSFIPYDLLFRVLNEVAAGYVNLYS